MLDQEKFFNTYKVQEAFEDSGLSWDTLEKIYEDYTRRLPEMKKIADRLQDEISKVIDFHVHSIHNRCKDPEHLIEKIIRKVGVEKRQKYKNINECLDKISAITLLDFNYELTDTDRMYLIIHLARLVNK